MATNSEKVERFLFKALSTAKRKRGFPKIKPSIEHVSVERSFSLDPGTAYPFTAIVLVQEYPTENQMDWFKKWRKELEHTTMTLEGVFFDESGDLYYVFSGFQVIK